MKKENWLELVFKIFAVGFGFFILFHAFRMAIYFILFILKG